MTVRGLYREAEIGQSRQRSVRWWEYLFLFIGLLALDYYIWVSLDSTVYQAYENWSFERQTQGRPVSFAKFLGDELGIGLNGDSKNEAEQTAERATPVGPDRPLEKSVTKPRAVAPPQPKPQPLAVIGRIIVPRLQLSAMVREGVGDDILRRAVGHIPYTALPGQPGNVALAGHRDTFFRKLRDIRTNDKIIISTMHGDYAYQVESLKIVTPKDVGVLKAVAGEQALTLVTCYPFYYVGSAPKRFIVKAKQIEASPQQPQTGF